MPPGGAVVMLVPRTFIPLPLPLSFAARQSTTLPFCANIANNSPLPFLPSVPLIGVWGSSKTFSIPSPNFLSESHQKWPPNYVPSGSEWEQSSLINISMYSTSTTMDLLPANNKLDGICKRLWTHKCALEKQHSNKTQVKNILK